MHMRAGYCALTGVCSEWVCTVLMCRAERKQSRTLEQFTYDPAAGTVVDGSAVMGFNSSDAEDMKGLRRIDDESNSAHTCVAKHVCR
jgi:hypothetical protein